jgi:hypothetical protein
VILSIALASAIIFILAGLAWTAARMVHVGNLDAHALAEKAGSPSGRVANGVTCSQPG